MPRWPRWRRWRNRDELSLRVQLVAVIALLAGVVAVALVGVVKIAVNGAADEAADRVLRDRASTLVAEIQATSRNDQIRVAQERLYPDTAVYDATGSLVAGSVLPPLEDTFTELSESRRTTTRSARGGLEIRAQVFHLEGGARGVVVMTEPREPYEETQHAALIVSIIAGGILVLTAAGSAAWISKRVLSPVEQMARTADEWSEHDLDRRFALGAPNNEISALGNTLDGLLDKVAGVIQAEQRLTSELAHELRTPLTTIQGVADLLAMRTDLDAQAQEDVALIKNATVAMSETITVLLEIARGATHTRARTSLADLGAELEAQLQAPGDVRLELPDDLAVDVPLALAVRALAPVVGNAMQVSDAVVVTGRLAGRTVEILVADDGPGIPDEWLETLFTPGWSGSGGSGLGLSLARRVARSGGGDVTLASRHNAHGGATFAIVFPGGVMSTTSPGAAPLT